MKIRIQGVKPNLNAEITSIDQAVGNKYTDLEITNLDKYVSGDITISEDQEAIIGSVRNILLTSFGELVYDYEAGANITSLLFGAGRDDIEIRTNIEYAINSEEPRVIVRNIDIQQDDAHTVFITVTVAVKGDEIGQDIEIKHRIQNLQN